MSDSSSLGIEIVILDRCVVTHVLHALELLKLIQKRKIVACSDVVGFLFYILLPNAIDVAFCVAKQIWKEYLLQIYWIPDYEYRTINTKGLQKLIDGLGVQVGTRGGGCF